jgi:hypothetical protein
MTVTYASNPTTIQTSTVLLPRETRSREDSRRVSDFVLVTD